MCLWLLYGIRETTAFQTQFISDAISFHLCCHCAAFLCMCSCALCEVGQPLGHYRSASHCRASSMACSTAATFNARPRAGSPPSHTQTNTHQVVSSLMELVVVKPINTDQGRACLLHSAMWDYRSSTTCAPFSQPGETSTQQYPARVCFCVICAFFCLPIFFQLQVQIRFE